MQLFLDVIRLCFPLKLSGKNGMFKKFNFSQQITFYFQTANAM